MSSTSVEGYLRSTSWLKDRWGAYRKTLSSVKLRIVFKNSKLSFRKFQMNKWRVLRSWHFSDIHMPSLEAFIGELKKKYHSEKKMNDYTFELLRLDWKEDEPLSMLMIKELEIAKICKTKKRNYRVIHVAQVIDPELCKVPYDTLEEAKNAVIEVLKVDAPTIDSRQCFGCDGHSMGEPTPPNPSER